MIDAKNNNYLLSQQIVYEALIKYREALLTCCADQVQQLILFGSQARGEATDESDIDVLVVVNWETEQLPSGFYAAPFSDPRWKAIVDTAYDISLDYGVYISPIVISDYQFQAWSPLLSQVKKEGVEIWTRNKK